MVSYDLVKESNSTIAKVVPAGLVAVFVGGTNGIGEYALKQFAQHAAKPRVYFIGRSQEAGGRIEKECKEMNPEGTFSFIQADTSLIKNVDKVCANIKEKESSINLLFLTQGSLDFHKETSEGLRLAVALAFYARTRFIYNLLPLLQASSSLKRVVSVFAGTKDGRFDIEDVDGIKVPITKARGHMASAITMAMRILADKAPDVSFIHNFPGPVKSGIGREMPGLSGMAVRTLGKVIGPIFYIPTDESGAYHLFFSTSARYAPKIGDSSAGVPLPKDISKARGIDGTEGSGMYVIDERGNVANKTVEALHAELKSEGTPDKLWKHTEDVWARILGSQTTQA